MENQLIVIIGGPGSGKTTLINELINRGYCCYPEISREITMQARERGIEQLFLEKPLLFSELLLEGRKKQFLEAKNQAQKYVFFDRGIPDILAYMHYIGDSYPPFFDVECKTHRYNHIFMLPPWEAIYQSDNERYETFDQAKLIHQHLEETYQKYGYSPVQVPLGSIADRVNFLLKHIG